MARRTLSELGEPGGPAPSLLEADLSHIWASQAAEVDRLSPAAREVVRPASVLGAEFPLSLLAAVCATAGPVGPAVGELCTRDLLQEVAGSPDPAFRR